jgi:HPt (histidine-containing phosphotransfer) domain-containing protein
MNENKIIDLTYLLNASSDKEFLFKMFSMFKTLVPEIRLLMSFALAHEEYKNLSELAHKLKSPISILGMAKTRKKIESLERDSKDIINVETYYNRIEDIFEDCSLAIDDMIECERKFK